MRLAELIQRHIDVARLYRNKSQYVAAGSRQALETLAARHERVARDLGRRL